MVGLLSERNWLYSNTVSGLGNSMWAVVAGRVISGLGGSGTAVVGSIIITGT